MILDCKFQILGIETTVGHYIITFSRNSSCLIYAPFWMVKSVKLKSYGNKLQSLTKSNIQDGHQTPKRPWIKKKLFF